MWRGQTWEGDRRPERCISIEKQRVFEGKSTHREDNRDSSSHSFAAVQRCLLTQPQIFRLATMALPAGNGCTVQQHLDALTRGQCGNDL